MKAVHSRIIGLFCLAALLAAGGCGGDSTVLMPEADEPLYREAQRLEKQGRTQEAFNDYLKVIAKRGDQAPESELDVGLIYLGHIKNPIEAIHYFDKYLEAEPNSRQAPLVRGLIDTAKRDFVSALGQPQDNQAPRLELADEVERLRRENGEMKAEIDSLRSGAGAPAPVPHPAPAGGDEVESRPMYAPPAVAAEETASPLTPAPLTVESAPPAVAPAAPARSTPSLAPSGRVHVVAKGDTLYLLAQHYYNNRSRWREIFAANRDQLASENTPLHLGMTLKIP